MDVFTEILIAIQHVSRAVCIVSFMVLLVCLLMSFKIWLDREP